MDNQSTPPFKRVVFRTHAVQRMFQRFFSKEDVLRILRNGEVVENYPDDTPYPSQLILGWIGARPIHIVSAFNLTAQEAIVITVYEPDGSQWEPDFKRRKL